MEEWNEMEECFIILFLEKKVGEGEPMLQEKERSNGHFVLVIIIWDITFQASFFTNNKTMSIKISMLN